MDNTEAMENYLQAAYVGYVQKKGRITSAAEFAKYLGVSNTSLSQWMNGQRLPTGNNVHMLAAKLGPEVYDILGQPRRMPDNPDIERIIQGYFEMNEAERQELLDFIEVVMGKHRVEHAHAQVS